jgi:dolichol-phosphate mannosyltransferase
MPTLVAICFMMGVMSILIGLLAEIVVRVYFESQAKPIYFINNTVNLDTGKLPTATG